MTSRRVLVGLLTGWLAAGLVGGPAAAAADRAFRERLAALHVTPLSGQEAPAFSLPGPGGGRRSLEALGRRAALLYFWASW